MPPPSESPRFAPVGDGMLGDPLPQVPCGHLGLFKIGPLRGLGQMPARLSEKLHAPVTRTARRRKSNCTTASAQLAQVPQFHDVED